LRGWISSVENKKLKSDEANKLEKNFARDFPFGNKCVTKKQKCKVRRGH